jgi:threonine aldolase
MTLEPVDLRSDTVTRPTADMRRAIATAIVGDDVFNDDPTVHELQARIAALTGKEAALYVPSGTMGNQIAVACLTHPGDEVVLEALSHIYVFEQGGLGANSGCLAHPVASPRGILEPESITRALRGPDDHVSRLSLVCVENTHNRHGGSIWPLEALEAISTTARRHGLAVHLDGARLWNASVATGIPIRTWASHADTVTMCFSKGLGAPVGSILSGSAELIGRARRFRKRWGGGMRQAGILAAACLHALDHHVERLADDHRRAKTLAAAIRQLPGLSVVEPETNIVFVHLEHAALERQSMLDGLAARGIRLSAYGPRLLRMITHLDVDDAGIARAIAAFTAVVEEKVGAATR